MNKKKVPSGLKIVIWAIIFWPVGLYYLLKRADIDIEGGRTYSRIIEGIGYFFVVIGFIALVGIGFAEKGAMIWLILCGLIYVGGGCLLVKKSKKVYSVWRSYIQTDKDVAVMITKADSKDRLRSTDHQNLLINDK